MLSEEGRALCNDVFGDYGQRPAVPSAPSPSAPLPSAAATSTAALSAAAPPASATSASAPPATALQLGRGTVLFDFKPQPGNYSQLAVNAGEHVEITGVADGSPEWVTAMSEVSGSVGLVPTSYVVGTGGAEHLQLQLPEFLEKLRPRHKRILAALVKLSTSKSDFISDQKVARGPLRFVTRTGVLLLFSWLPRAGFFKYLPVWLSISVGVLHLVSVAQLMLPRNKKFIMLIGLKTAGRSMLVLSNVLCVLGYFLSAFESDAYYASPTTETNMTTPVIKDYAFGGKNGDMCSTSLWAQLVSYTWQGQICSVMFMLCVFQTIIMKAASWKLSPHGKASNLFHELQICAMYSHAGE
jgi:hypothetical protein